MRHDIQRGPIELNMAQPDPVVAPSGLTIAESVEDIGRTLDQAALEENMAAVMAERQRAKLRTVGGNNMVTWFLLGLGGAWIARQMKVI